MSDATHLTNFSGNKNVWPVYMMIGNLSALVRMATTMHSLLLVALLPIAIKMHDIPLSRYNEQKEHNRMILQYVLHPILGPLMCADRRVFFAWCADSHFRRCVASPAAGIADYPEYRGLPKPDLLHTMQQGMLKHLLGWLSVFLKQYKCFEAFNNIWLSVPTYLDIVQPRQTYKEVSSW